MKVAMKGAMKSSTMAEFSQYANRLQADATKASKLQYKSDPETYHKGMLELQQELSVVHKAVLANDLKAAIAALQKVNASKKHYHDLLS
jgi:soluble cytochrome b562